MQIPAENYSDLGARADEMAFNNMAGYVVRDGNAMSEKNDQSGIRSIYDAAFYTVY